MNRKLTETDRLEAQHTAPTTLSEPNKGSEAGRIKPGPPAARPLWIRSLSAYDRRERREFQVTRFG
jgi:hypothetical protein